MTTNSFGTPSPFGAPQEPSNEAPPSEQASSRSRKPIVIAGLAGVALAGAGVAAYMFIGGGGAEPTPSAQSATTATSSAQPSSAPSKTAQPVLTSFNARNPFTLKAGSTSSGTSGATGSSGSSTYTGTGTGTGSTGTSSSSLARAITGPAGPAGANGAAGKDGKSATQEMVDAAVKKLLANQQLGVTQDMVNDAVAKYCADGACTGGTGESGKSVGFGELSLGQSVTLDNPATSGVDESSVEVNFTGVTPSSDIVPAKIVKSGELLATDAKTNPVSSTITFETVIDADASGAWSAGDMAKFTAGKSTYYVINGAAQPTFVFAAVN